MVEISEERYKALLKSERVLEVLYANGVTNWEWWDDAMDDLEDMEDDE